MLKEFKAFVMRGNVVDMAVGIVIGAAFGAIVKNLVDAVLMPPLGLLLGGIDFSQAYIVLKQPPVAGDYHTAAEITKAGGVAMQYGLVVNAIISFTIVAFALFMLVKGVNRLMAIGKREEKADPTTRECPECLSTIPVKASRCAHCTALVPKPA